MQHNCTVINKSMYKLKRDRESHKMVHLIRFFRFVHHASRDNTVQYSYVSIV